MHTFVFIDTILHKLILLKLQYVQRNTFCKFFFSLAHSYIVELLTGVMQLFNKFAGVDYALCIFLKYFTGRQRFNSFDNAHLCKLTDYPILFIWA